MYGADYPDPPEWQVDPDGTPPPSIWADVGAFLDKGIPEPPQPVALRREDGNALFYAGKVNVLFGDPECGKSWIAYAAVVQALAEGRKAAIIDVDHNGLAEVITRLLALGARPDSLRDPGRFKYAEPEDGIELRRAVSELREWRAAVAVVDSLGEILPMLGLSSNSPDDYTSAHREILTSIAQIGTCVIAIDHLPKNEEARMQGQTGTKAKLRAVNGASIRVAVRDQFAPGRGGSARSSSPRIAQEACAPPAPLTASTSPPGCSSWSPARMARSRGR
jgi:hypothetical protein